MRITFVLSHINISGGNRSVFEMANRLQERGHEVFVVYPFLPNIKNKKWYDIRKMPGRILRFWKNLQSANNVGWFDLKAGLIKVPTLTEKYIPDADIIAVAWWQNAFDISSYGQEKGNKFYMIRGYEAHEEWDQPKEKVIESYALPLCKIVCAKWLQDLLEKNFSQKVEAVLPNGINFKNFYLQRQGFKCYNSKRVGILYRGLALKGCSDGLKAFLQAQEKYPDINLVIFGEEIAERDKEFVKKVKNLHYYKLPSKEQLRKIYNSLDVFVFSSHSEGFPNPPAEAMACGAAVISTNVGAVPDYAENNRTAIIVPPKQPEKIAEALIDLLENESKRKQIAQAGYEYIQRFTWDKTIDKLEKIFKNSLKSNI